MLLTILVSVGLVALDQLFKYLAVQHLTAGSVQVVIPHVIGLTYVENDGAAFNLFSGLQTLLVVITAVALLVFGVVLLFRRPKDKLVYLAMLLIFAGGIGNLIDRVRVGYVVDYLAFLFIDFPVFNLADICVVVGFALWVVALLREEVQNRRAPAAKGGAAGKTVFRAAEQKEEVIEITTNERENNSEINGDKMPKKENGGGAAPVKEDHGEA